MEDKVYILVAGVNGAGKSTFYHSVQDIGSLFEFCDGNILQGLHRVNADEILKEFGDWRNPKDSMEAGRIAVKRIRKYLKDGASFCQETTLCGRGVVRNIVAAKDSGYKVGIIYVGVEGPEIAVSRVQQRVQAGGHGVDPADVRRRYDESLSNINAVLDRCDGVLFFDNTHAFRPVGIFNGRSLQMINSLEDTPKWFLNRVYTTGIEKGIVSQFCSEQKIEFNNPRTSNDRDDNR